jgi:hypothetical protein
MTAARNTGIKYERMPLEEIGKLIQLFDKLFKLFVRLKGFPENVKFHTSFYSLVDIIIRVDKRKAYYQCFHNMEINECKEVALYAYWILKLRPFTITETDTAYTRNVDVCTINESFVAFLIGLVLEATGRIKRTPGLKDDYNRLVDYSFRFRNFSIDSFVVLIETIGTDTLEREYPNLADQL